MGGGPAPTTRAESNLSPFGFNRGLRTADPLGGGGGGGGGDGEEILLELMNSKSQAVFGGVPTMEEAKEATSELKDALEIMYLPSTNANGGLKSSMVVQEPAPGYSDSKACVTKEDAVASSSLPKRACEAFSLLNRSHEAQRVVASIACDENVWNAVMQNEKVMEFLRFQKSSHLSPDMDMVVKAPFRDRESRDDYKTLKHSVDEANTKDSEGSGNMIMKILNNLKLTLAEVLKSLSILFENIFRDLLSGGISTDADGKPSATNVDRSIGSTFIALGMLAIMVVVLNREETSIAVQLMNQQDAKYVNFLLKTFNSK